MRITFEIPDTTKAFHGCAVYDSIDPDVIHMQMCTWDMPTDGLEDGMIIRLPDGKRLDGEKNEP